MDAFFTNFSFGLLIWQIVAVVNIILVIWSLVCLFKSKKQNASIKLLIFIALITFPIISSLIYLTDYYNKDLKDKML